MKHFPLFIFLLLPCIYFITLGTDRELLHSKRFASIRIARNFWFRDHLLFDWSRKLLGTWLRHVVIGLPLNLFPLFRRPPRHTWSHSSKRQIDVPLTLKGWPWCLPIFPSSDGFWRGLTSMPDVTTTFYIIWRKKEDTHNKPSIPFPILKMLIIILNDAITACINTSFDNDCFSSFDIIYLFYDLIDCLLH